FTASLLTEGADGMSALQLAEEIAFLGASVNAGAVWDQFGITVRAPKRTFNEAMALAATVVLRPNFAAADGNPVRDLRRGSCPQAKDQPGVVAQRVFYRNVYPANHPLHVSITGDSASTAPLDSAAVRSFWTRAANPARATLIL